MLKYGKRKYTMSKQAFGEALKERLAKIQLEKQKTLEQLWNIEFTEQTTLEKMKRYGMFTEKNDLPQANDS